MPTIALTREALISTYKPIAAEVEKNEAFRKKLRKNPVQTLVAAGISEAASHTWNGRLISSYILEDYEDEMKDPPLRGLQNAALSFIAKASGPF